MSLLEKTKLLLRTHRIHPKKLLGQNFMVEHTIFQRMIDCASLDHDDTVLDVGAGLGFLTRFVAEKCRTVLAIEVDPGLVCVLREQLADVPNIKIVEGDVFRAEVPAFNKVVSIPPYRISSTLLSWLFSRDFDFAVLIFQEEFANRLVTPVGSSDYGWLTVLTYYYAEVELLNDVSKSMFYPRPKVDSRIIFLKSKKPKPFMLRNEASFKQLVQSLFRKRNRKVRNAVLPYLKGSCLFPKKKAAEIAGSLPFRDRRVRELTPEDFGVLANAITE